MQGLIFVVDSNDRERINEAKDELMRMVSKTYSIDDVFVYFVFDGVCNSIVIE